MVQCHFVHGSPHKCDFARSSQRRFWSETLLAHIWKTILRMAQVLRKPWLHCHGLRKLEYTHLKICWRRTVQYHSRSELSPPIGSPSINISTWWRHLLGRRHRIHCIFKRSSPHHGIHRSTSYRREAKRRLWKRICARRLVLLLLPSLVRLRNRQSA